MASVTPATDRAAGRSATGSGTTSRNTLMWPYQAEPQAYCGVDQPASSMSLRIFNPSGSTVLDREFPAKSNAFLDAIAPHRDCLVVATKCNYSWHCLADLCLRAVFVCLSRIVLEEASAPDR